MKKFLKSITAAEDADSVLDDAIDELIIETCDADERTKSIK